MIIYRAQAAETREKSNPLTWLWCLGIEMTHVDRTAQHAAMWL